MATRIDAELLIPGKGEPVEDGSVVMDGGGIVYVGPSTTAPNADRVTSVQTVMPGLWECHGHFPGILTANLESELKEIAAVKTARATDDCTDRNRGLVSDLLAPTVYQGLQDAGLRTCVIHNLFHGARQPWTEQVRDQWWHLSNLEMRTIKDICSDEDVEQYEPFVAANIAPGPGIVGQRPVGW